MTGPSVVIVRPWADADGGSGCCGGRVRDAVCVGDDTAGPHDHDAGRSATGELYRRLRSVLPDVDVQIVSSTNTAFLVPWSFRAARRRGDGWRSIRAAFGSTRAGAVLVDGAVIGEVEVDDPAELTDRVVGACMIGRARTA